MLKKILLCLMLISIFLIGINVKDNKISYISIGDGLSKGMNYNDFESIGYSDHLYNYLKKNNNVELYTKDFSNENNRITDLIDDINNNISLTIDNKTIYIQNAIKNSDILTISIGMNEILYKYTNHVNNGYMYSYIDECISDLNKLLKIITKLNNNDIFLIGYYNPTDDNELDEFIKYTNNKIITLCNNYKINYIDTYNIFNNNKHMIYSKNNYYPNQDGYKLIANAVKSKLNLVNK